MDSIFPEIIESGDINYRQTIIDNNIFPQERNN